MVAVAGYFYVLPGRTVRDENTQRPSPGTYFMSGKKRTYWAN